MDNLDHFDAAKILVLLVPGSVIVLFRSFALRGSFPSISKDDFAAFVLCSVIYDFTMLAAQASLPISVTTVMSGLRSTYWFLTFLIIPAVVGFILGLFEASDLVGQIMRRIGVKFPSPTPTAWETLFQELQRDAILIITLIRHPADQAGMSYSASPKSLVREGFRRMIFPAFRRNLPENVSKMPPVSTDAGVQVDYCRQHRRIPKPWTSLWLKSAA